MLLGDTHGNTDFVTTVVIPAAQAKGVQWIYQVGDFGYWEHQNAGQVYLTAVNEALVRHGMHMIFIQGNHDKVSMISETYLEEDGFYKVRSNLWYAQNGTVWSPNKGKTNFMALGGAYSVDKRWRLEREQYLLDQIHKDLRATYESTYRESLWFPEEEITDDELDVILSNVNQRVDVLLTHDKPFSANTPFELLPIRECEPNQRRIDKAIKALTPKLVVHGHLHKRYTTSIRNSDSGFTVVEGLGADVSYDEESAWEFMDI
jgi:Icc-related predicted phosphoesterase